MQAIEEASVPWLSEEIPGWEEMDDEEREAMLACLRDLGLEFPPEADPDDYFE